MPAKITVIWFCGDCPNRYYEVNDLHCELTFKKTYENSEIPEWCPLMDAPVAPKKPRRSKQK